MQLVTFVSGNEGTPKAGVHRDGVVIDLAAVGAGKGISLPDSVLALLEGGTDLLQQAAQLVQEAPSSGPGVYAVDEVKLLAPIPRPPKILALAGNFVDHIVEGGGRPRPKEGAIPHIFIKPASSVIGPDAAIEIPTVSNAVDYELELAVVIGQRTKNVSVDEAMSAVAGYAVFNDVSGRTMSYPHRAESTERDAWFDWLNGKWCDTFAAWGPYLVTADEIADPSDLAMTLTVNGETRQNGSTRQMIFNVPETIAFISAICTLEPGDVIAMGTPAGVGATTETYLQPGDVVTGTIAGLGTLKNPVAKPD